MAKVGYKISGFDISESQVATCRRRAAEFGYTDRCDFSVQLAENLQYDDDSFDCIVGIDILHHIEIEPAIREVHRVLKDDGVAIFREWIEVPAFDLIRESRLVRSFFSKEMSFDEHRTHDERKLNREDMAIIKSIFPNVHNQRFCISSRVRRFFPKRDVGPCRFEKFDRQLMKIAPPASALGGEIVLELRK